MYRWDNELIFPDNSQQGKKMLSCLVTWLMSVSLTSIYLGMSWLLTASFYDLCMSSHHSKAQNSQRDATFLVPIGLTLLLLSLVASQASICFPANIKPVWRRQHGDLYLNKELVTCSEETYFSPFPTDSNSNQVIIYYANTKS